VRTIFPFRYFRLFAIERISPDTPYLHEPRSIEEYREMAEVAGAPLLNIITIPPPTINGTEALPYTAAQVRAILSEIAPAVAVLSSAGLFGRAYVYGFDERPHTKSWIAAINQIFGAVKDTWPTLKTIAALRWSVRLRLPSGHIRFRFRSAETALGTKAQRRPRSRSRSAGLAVRAAN
jgi:hypothetical protein